MVTVHDVRESYSNSAGAWSNILVGRSGQESHHKRPVPLEEGVYNGIKNQQNQI